MLGRGTKADLLGEHDELQHVPALATSEAKPTLRCLEHMQVWATAIGVKRTPSDERMSLSSELDAVAGHNIFNWVRQLESGRVDPACWRCGASSLYCHSG